MRLPDDLLALVDALVERGRFASRADVIREGIMTIAETERRRAVDRAHEAGYARIPPTPAEEAAAVASLRESILEEPW